MNYFSFNEAFVYQNINIKVAQMDLKKKKKRSVFYKTVHKFRENLFAK